MDTKGFIAEHSKAKLELYSRYLRSYLAVLLTTPKFDSIVIHDIFAGCGIAANAEKGSAVIAAEIIDAVGKSHNPQHKPISLKLNDADQKSVDQLKVLLKNCSFIEFNSTSADNYVSRLAPKRGQHCLFFIDPYGYTQISAANLRWLFSRPHSDLLVFVPIYHVYRFLRHSEQSEQLGAIANFLGSFGVDEAAAKISESLVGFADVVKQAIGRLSNKKRVNKQILRNKSHNSTYCLFFLTDHVLGAEKFLDAKEAKQSESNEVQIGFQFLEEIEQAQKQHPFKAALQPGNTYDNLHLYELGIRYDLRPTDVNDALRTMEQSGRIVVAALGTKPRNLKSFYIGYKYYKNSERRVAITVRRA